MYSVDQLLAHLIGDYFLQSNWMATQKTTQSKVAFIHAFFYTLPFLFLTQSVVALAIIIFSHFLIDRYRLARYVVWLKNGASGPVTNTGYPEEVPPWLSVWLLIIVDNTMHVIINGLALHYFG